MADILKSSAVQNLLKKIGIKFLLYASYYLLLQQIVGWAWHVAELVTHDSSSSLTFQIICFICLL